MCHEQSYLISNLRNEIGIPNYLEEVECSKMIGFQNDWIPKTLDSKMIGI